jgi:hypothetical protein
MSNLKTKPVEILAMTPEGAQFVPFVAPIGMYQCCDCGDDACTDTYVGRADDGSQILWAHCLGCADLFDTENSLAEMEAYTR